MTRTIFIYGALAGLIVIGSMLLSHVLVGTDRSMAVLEWVGYLIMLVGLSLIFFGIKGYRDKQLGGVIRFGTAFAVGLGISAVASLCYVVVWEINLQLTDFAFIDVYASSIVEEARAEGMAGAELDALIAETEAVKTNYARPLYRWPLTLLEIFPMGLLISLISAAVLRQRG